MGHIILPSIFFFDVLACQKYLSYVLSCRSASGYITAPYTALDTKPAPFMAAFSSQGPNTVTPQILKVRTFSLRPVAMHAPSAASLRRS
jgi:hypothetical protein